MGWIWHALSNIVFMPHLWVSWFPEWWLFDMQLSCWKYYQFRCQYGVGSTQTYWFCSFTKSRRWLVHDSSCMREIYSLIVLLLKYQLWVWSEVFFSKVLVTLCAACGARFICHHELWSTSVRHTVSSRNSSLGLASGKLSHKITIPIFRLVLKILLFRVAFLIFIPSASTKLKGGYTGITLSVCPSVDRIVSFISVIIFSPYYLLVGLLLQYVALF